MYIIYIEEYHLCKNLESPCDAIFKTLNRLKNLKININSKQCEVTKKHGVTFEARGTKIKTK